jgi:hypothetical protein
MNNKLIEIHGDLKMTNVDLDVINAEFLLAYNYIFTNGNDAVDVLYNFRTEIKVIRAQAYI